MKTLQLSGALVLTCGMANAAVLVQDDFNDDSLDTSKWSVVIGTGSSMGSPTVTEQNQRLEMGERGYLVTQNQYDPASTLGLRIEGVWGFSATSDDMLQILTRSDATPSGQYGETSNGVEFFAYQNDAQIRNRGSASVTGGTDLEGSAFSTAAGTIFDFVITDDGTNLTFSMQEQTNADNWATLTATSTSDMPIDYVVFHNREGGSRMSFLDEVTISEIPEPSSSLLLAALGGLGWISGRRRRG